tara:strand:- start:1039 stop:2346 length:1308 start_codon:yes stop_codon:yes gene_type:complete
MRNIIRNILRESVLTEGKKSFFRRVSLPYDYDAVKDFVGYETMWEHYNKHYKGYTTKLNDALSKRKNPPTDIEKIIRGIKNYNTFTRNNAGGYYNHSLFFRDYITPDKKDLSKELKTKINKDFGSLDNFKRQFDEEAEKVFGSGWCWLVLKNGRLKIVSTPNQDNPLMDNLGEPLLGLDVWEHAYYLNYMADRKKYINNFWKICNWEKVSNKFEELTNTTKGIIEEQVEGNDEEDLPAGYGEEYGPEFYRRLATFLNAMKRISGLEEYIPLMKKYGSPQGFGSMNPKGTEMYKEIMGTVKLMGATLGEDKNSIGIQPDVFTYLAVKTFLVNGGYDSNLNPRNADELYMSMVLPEVHSYDMEANVQQELIEYKSSYGNVIGADSPEEAIQIYHDHPYAWEEDSEHQDSDYGDIIEVENVEVYETKTYKWLPNFLGV